MECFMVKQNTIALWDGRVGVISISQMGKQVQTGRGSELHTHEEPDLALGPPNSLGLCESDALEMWLSPVPSRSPAVFTLPLDLYIAGPPTSQRIKVTVSGDACSASLPWDTSIRGWGHSLGSDTSRSDQVRFNNMNCIHVSSEMLQESELLWGADMVSQQVILRKFVLDSSVDPGVCQAEENGLGAFYSMPAVGRSVLQPRCKVNGDEVPLRRMFDRDSALKEHKLAKERKSGEDRESHTLKIIWKVLWDKLCPLWSPNSQCLWTRLCLEIRSLKR